MDIYYSPGYLKRYLDTAIDMFKPMRIPRRKIAKFKKRDNDNKRALVCSYPNGPTMSRHEENLIREGIIVR